MFSNWMRMPTSSQTMYETEEQMTEEWMQTPLDQTVIKKSMVVALKGYLGKADATLGDVAGMPMAELRAIKGAGKVAVDSCLHAIKIAALGAPAHTGPSVLEVVMKAATPQEAAE